ncbi:hypothetical protein MJO28_006082 [Puccinia striiformis f. sp. tritici]|uniref:Uncharacterized protein n=1 Tax=Puccinia striiformis f. sp. tritici TaxID=168172 RepID=A0ACC0EGU3_9BASI|nr:hypothetical protein MJO28_006082 [Puccinia striiformis f. sp. tritici]KAI7957879.1 hypothetical protein MJO29_006096 [Puccinia striiformis f. sp. tritici]
MSMRATNGGIHELILRLLSPELELSYHISPMSDIHRIKPGRNRVRLPSAPSDTGGHPTVAGDDVQSASFKRNTTTSGKSLTNPWGTSPTPSREPGPIDRIPVGMCSAPSSWDSLGIHRHRYLVYRDTRKPSFWTFAALAIPAGSSAVACWSLVFAFDVVLGQAISPFPHLGWEIV